MSDATLTREQRVILQTVEALDLSQGEALRRICRQPAPKPTPESTPEADAAPAARRTHPRAQTRALALKVLRWASEDLAAAGERLAEANGLYEAADRSTERAPDHDDWQRWVDTCVFARCDAEERLAALVMMLHGRLKGLEKLDELGKGWKPVAMELDGEHLVAVPRDEDDDPRPVLIVVDSDDFDSCQYGIGAQYEKGGAL